MNKKKLVFILIVGVLLLVVVKTNYKEINNENIISDSINYKQGFKSLAMYKNDGSGDVEITTMPESGYEINKEKSYCTTDNINKVYNKMYTDENGNHIITGLEKDSKCYIYFDKKVTAGETILGNVTVKDSATSFTTIATTDEGVFKAKDDDGDTYYWRGAVTNNYVKFADKYWRIIRINGDGTIRLIYQGTSATSTGTDTQIGTSAFNSTYNNNMYFGFKYSIGIVHGTDTNSTILEQLNNWYITNLSSHENKIDSNAGFCNDRTPSTSMSTSNGSGGTGKTTTYYGAFIRILPGGSFATAKIQTPTFNCYNSKDLFTKSGASKGNKSLTNPIGLITVDEVIYAGGFAGNINSNYYLYTESYFWTMSPCNYNSSDDYAYVFVVYGNGSPTYSVLNNKFGIRPVINLRSDIKLTGTGTASDPYVVQ